MDWESVEATLHDLVQGGYTIPEALELIKKQTGELTMTDRDREPATTNNEVRGTCEAPNSGLAQTPHYRNSMCVNWRPLSTKPTVWLSPPNVIKGPLPETLPDLVPKAEPQYEQHYATGVGTWWSEKSAEPQAREPQDFKALLARFENAVYWDAVINNRGDSVSDRKLRQSSERVVERRMEMEAYAGKLRKRNEELKESALVLAETVKSQNDDVIRLGKLCMELERQNKELTEALRNVRECKQVVTARGIAFKALRGAQRKD